VEAAWAAPVPRAAWGSRPSAAEEAPRAPARCVWAAAGEHQPLVQCQPRVTQEARAVPREETCGILPIPTLSASGLPHRKPPPLPTAGARHHGSAAAAVDDGPSAVASLREEVLELRQLLAHACARIDALTEERAASISPPQLDARLTLLENELKISRNDLQITHELMRARAAHHPAATADLRAAPSRAPFTAPAAAPAMGRAAELTPAAAPAAPPADAAEGDAAPAASQADQLADSPAGVMDFRPQVGRSELGPGTRLTLGALPQAAQPCSVAAGGPGGPVKPMTTTYESTAVLPGSKAFAEYVSTQAFISDMSRRFVSTQQLLQPPAAPAAAYAQPSLPSLPLEVEALHP